MKICLINPPFVLHETLDMPRVFQPMGLAYIAAVLRNNHSVFVLDAVTEGWENLKKVDGQNYLGLSIEKIKEKVAEINPDIVGISSQFSINEKSSIDVAQAVRDINPNIITILGGTHVTVASESILANTCVDFAIIGEGEDTILELIQVLEDKEHDRLHLVKGIAYRQKDKILRTPSRDFIDNLDALPFPARDLFPMEKYFAAAKAGRGSRQSYTPSSRWIDLLTSRGCPYNCVFCSIHLSMGRKFRFRSPGNIIKEIEQAIKQYKIRHVNFEDDNISLDRKRFGQICDLIIERKLNITWSLPNGLRVENIDEEIVKKMKKSGCYRVFVAPESGVQRVVKEIVKKNLDLKKIEKAVILFKKYNIIVDGSFVIGFPGETKDDIKNTIKYAGYLKKLGMSYAGFHIATPLYGTDLYKQAKADGYLKEGFNSALLSPTEPLIETPDWTAEEIKELQKLAGWKVCLNFWQKCFIVIKKILYFPFHPSNLNNLFRKIKKYFFKF